MIRIEEITAPQAYKIRKDVLRDGIPLTEKMDGDFDESTIHLGVFVDGVLACVATFMQHDSLYFSGFQYRLRGMATHIAYQHKGLGKIILEWAEQLLTQKNVDILWCNARVVALGFYKKSGYQIIGTEFVVHLIGPHFVMFKNLKND
ncbi:MAG: GNAT family N-acetyltransferase [Flavobacteriaceae bacterium]